METGAVEPESDREIRCPKLGHAVSFGYCLKERIDSPCARAVRCWNQVFDADTWFREKIGADEFDKCFNEPPAPKLVTLVDLIRQAQETLRK
jgi:hypothetical protein